jgi:ribosome-associated protein
MKKQITPKINIPRPGPQNPEQGESEEDMVEAKDFALDLAKALDKKKGKKISVLKTGELTTIAEYFVICTGGSTTQIRALADECEKIAEEQGEELHHREGHGGEWMLLDFSDVVVHLFLEEARDFYNLERLWADAQPIDLTGVLEPD